MKNFFVFSFLFLCSATIFGTELRIASLVLSPEQKPNIEVVAETPINGTLSLAPPEGWKIVPPTITAVADQKRFVFTVVEGRPNEKNSYPISVTVQRHDGTVLQHRQNVCVATAPNSSLVIAGPNDQGNAVESWDHAIPCSVTVHGKPIRIHTVWNRKRLCLLVEINDVEFVHAKNDQPFTAVQIALGAVRSDKTLGELYQFLLFADEIGRGHLVSLKNADSPPSLPDIDASQTFVWKHENTLRWETAIPFAAIPAIKPGEGRELTLSFLIHDAANKTVLDWGQTCLLTNESVEKWCRWKGDSIGNTILTVPRSEWGLCSSKF